MIGVSYTMSDLVCTFRDLIKQSDELEDWCQTNYGKSFILGIGADERREWGNADAPFIVIIPTGLSTGVSESNLSFSIDVDIAVSDPEFSDTGYIGVQEMLGIFKLDEFMNLVINVLRNVASVYNVAADLINVELDSSTYFPLHVASLNVTVNSQHLLGGQLLGLGGQ